MKKGFNSNSKKILVTGGAGFIGSHLVKKLVETGFRVMVWDIQVKPLGKTVRFEKLDIRNQKKVEQSLQDFKPDFVFHLAAQAIVTSSYDNPLEALKTNVMGTVNILEAVRLNSSVQGLIVASSDKAYGKLESGKYKQSFTSYKETDALRGDHPYDVSKSCADLICQAYFKTYGLPICVTRFGNVYGEGDLHFDRIIPGICESIIKKKTLSIRSNGRYIRDYLYVKDVVEGYIFLMKNFNKIKGQAFNFSSSETLSVLELIKKVEEILKVKISYKILNTAKNEIPYQHLDDSKIKKLGWKNQDSLSEGLKMTFNWYQTIL